MLHHCLKKWALECLRTINFLLLLGYGYMRNNLARLGGYPIHWGVADMSNLFYFHCVLMWSSRMTRLLRSHLSKRNGMNRNRYKHLSQPDETKIIIMHMYQFKLTNKELHLFLSGGYETDFILTQKYVILFTEPAHISRYFCSI